MKLVSPRTPSHIAWAIPFAYAMQSLTTHLAKAGEVYVVAPRDSLTINLDAIDFQGGGSSGGGHPHASSVALNHSGPPSSTQSAPAADMRVPPPAHMHDHFERVIIGTHHPLHHHHHHSSGGGSDLLPSTGGKDIDDGPSAGEAVLPPLRPRLSQPAKSPLGAHSSAEQVSLQVNEDRGGESEGVTGERASGGGFPGFQPQAGGGTGGRVRRTSAAGGSTGYSRQSSVKSGAEGSIHGASRPLGSAGGFARESRGFVRVSLVAGRTSHLGGMRASQEITSGENVG